jgi:3'-5' exoribonuclease
MIKKQYISDLKVGESIFGEPFAVKSAKRGATRNNKPFIDIELSDATGSIKGKVWSDDMANCETVAEGDVVNINATVEEFMNAPQIKITNMSKTEKYDLGELQQKSKFDIEKMWGDVEKTISTVKNPHLKKLLSNVFTKEFTEKFKNSSAAYRVHHAYLGGLLEHTWEMLKMAESLKGHYPKINMDLVNTGIVLHDIGKAYEYETKTTIGISDEGKLLGHIFIGADIVKHNAPKDIPIDLLNEVIHILLSHHGELQFGSPVVPMTVEALAVSTLDMASSKLNMAYNHIHGELGNDLYTQYVSQLGTELYRSPYIEDLSNEDIPF